MARIALDIDSTLHPYWDLLQRVVRDRYGVHLPYEDQHDWGITALERDALVHCVEETHTDENIAAGEPYPDAVSTVAAWHESGHWIHVTSHRRVSAEPATERWLQKIGMPYDDLHCSFDKVTRCVELGIDVLVDDSPVNIRRAREAGILRGHHRPPLERRARGQRRGDRGAGLARAPGGARPRARPDRLTWRCHVVCATERRSDCAAVAGCAGWRSAPALCRRAPPIRRPSRHCCTAWPPDAAARY